MTINGSLLRILIAPRKTALYTIKLAALWLILIAKLREAILMELVQVVAVILVMVPPMEDMDRATMNLNTNARDLMKPNAIPHHVLSHRIIVREEKVCEKLTEMVPVPVERQNCHDENKKVCELE